MPNEQTEIPSRIPGGKLHFLNPICPSVKETTQCFMTGLVAFKGNS
jgi:hypothetical protein